MATIRGSLDSSRCPVVTVGVSAPSNPSRPFAAVVDTGFTGFVQLPESRAQELGLAPRTTSETQYADGRIDIVPLAWGKVTLGTEVQEGLVHLQHGSDEVIVLVLSIADGTVLLVDSIAEFKKER